MLWVRPDISVFLLERARQLSRDFLVEPSPQKRANLLSAGDFNQRQTRMVKGDNDYFLCTTSRQRRRGPAFTAAAEGGMQGEILKSRPERTFAVYRSRDSVGD